MGTVISDDEGNLIIVDGEFLKIKLKSEEGRIRMLGQIDFEKGFLHVIRHRGRHLHVKSKSYGFNYYVLSTAKRFDKIMMKEVSGSMTRAGKGGKVIARYLIPVDAILEKGHYLHHQSSGFELQIFLTLEDMEQFKRKR